MPLMAMIMIAVTIMIMVMLFAFRLRHRSLHLNRREGLLVAAANSRNGLIFVNILILAVYPLV